MPHWREIIKPEMRATPYQSDDEPSAIEKMYREHRTDEVFEGYQDFGFFYPTCRLRRHFIDGELVESERYPLKPLDPRVIAHTPQTGPESENEDRRIKRQRVQGHRFARD